MPDAPDPITSPPDTSFQPYDAAGDGDAAGWMKVSDSGPADPGTFMATGDDWPDGPGPWRQT